MKNWQKCVTLLIGLFLAGCVVNSNKQATDMDALIGLMSGQFSSLQQSLDDDRYFHISLKMMPIWTNHPSGKWLYVEQAVGSQLDKPYRQRVYHVTALSDGRFSSAVYELPNPEAAVGAYDNPSLLSEISPEELKLRVGCAVILNAMAGDLFNGSTQEKACLSTLRGAAYATSTVEISTAGISSWDQGFDADDKQVWGATAGPYVFDRID